MKKVILSTLILLVGCSESLQYEITENHENGNIKTITVSSQNRVQYQLTFTENGVIETSDHFVNTYLQSRWTSDLGEYLPKDSEYFGNGSLRKSGSTIHDEIHGPWTFYDRSGHLEAFRYFNEGDPTGIWVNFDHEGHPVKFEDHGLAKHNGITTTYFQNKNINSIDEYHDGKLHGQHQEYFTNGQLSVSGEYDHGKQTGEWTYYTEENKIERLESYNSGMKDGEWRQFYASGQMKFRGLYKNNNRSGQWVWYDQDGNNSHTKIY